jgi:hypothetical protein
MSVFEKRNLKQRSHTSAKPFIFEKVLIEKESHLFGVLVGCFGWFVCWFGLVCLTLFESLSSNINLKGAIYFLYKLN